MRTLFFDCGMGAAGDMLQGALVSLLSREEQESFISEINSIGLNGVTVKLEDDIKCGITGKHVRVLVDDIEEHSNDVLEHHSHGTEATHTEEHEHHHEHHHVHHEHHHSDENQGQDHADGHEHHHTHHHATMDEIHHIVSHLKVSDKVKKDVMDVYEIIAKAESSVHNRPVSEVHFHEVGMMDALADIVGVAMLIEKINPDKIFCSPINVGYGKVQCAHGILPVPAPATAEIIRGIPVYAGRFEGEMCTPTGAALLSYYTDEFSNMPAMVVEKNGYGCGNKDFKAANVVGAVLGKSEDTLCDNNASEVSDSVIELRCNVDDMTGEDLAYAMEILLQNGARDAFVTPVVMKKGRSGFLITVLCNEEDRDMIAGLLFKHTSTIGIRQCSMDRIVLKRRMETVSTEYGDVSVKISEGYGVKRVKAELEDIKKLSLDTGLSLNELRKTIEKEM